MEFSVALAVSSSSKMARTRPSQVPHPVQQYNVALSASNVWHPWWIASLISPLLIDMQMQIKSLSLIACLSDITINYMNTFLWIFLALFFVVPFVYVQTFAKAKFLSLLQAGPLDKAMLWAQVKQNMELLARQQRVGSVKLMVIPDFSPNAIVFKSHGVVHVLLAEGLVRSLSAKELEAALLLCLAYGRRKRALWTKLSFLMLPVAHLMQQLPGFLKYLFMPLFSLVIRIFVNPTWVLRADDEVAQVVGHHVVAALLQKLAVAGKKMPVRRWSLAVDHLYLLSPMLLEGTNFGLFRTQLSVAERREHLLTSHTTTSPAFNS